MVMLVNLNYLAFLGLLYIKITFKWGMVETTYATYTVVK